jgi:FMN phosphatase YigB (HAD superfamily)
MERRAETVARVALLGTVDRRSGIMTVATECEQANFDFQELLRRLEGVRYAVFDLDGTLYDARDFERPALAAVAGWLEQRSQRQLSGLCEALWSRRESQRHRPGLFDDILAEFSLPLAWGAECAQRFHAYSGKELGAAPSLAVVLRELVSRRCRLALVSNGYPDVQSRKLERLGVSDIFDRQVFCRPDRPEQLKPSEWGWIQLAQWRSGNPAVHVGDDPVDEAFARAGAAQFVNFVFRNRCNEN